MNPKIVLRWMSLALLATVVAACSSGESSSPVNAPADANKTPADAVSAWAVLMKKGDIDGMLRTSLPAADYQKVRQAYADSQFKTQAVSAEDKAKFAAQMKKLTAPDAEQKIFEEIKPALEQFNTKYKAQLPMYVGMGQTMAATAIDKSKTMSAQEKQQTKDVLQALAQWVQTTNWGDQDKAKQAIAIVCDTARKLDIQTLDQARALSYEQAMQKYSQAWNALKQVVAIYGLDIDKTLDSVEAKTVSSADGKATVAYSYSIFDKPMQGEIALVERDGHWYNPKFIQQMEKSLAEQAAATAAAGSAAAPATATSAAK
ncbi:MAG TPA: hypothetical protein VFG73_02010 [Rhodanobacteraceae bacterium]|nr:hypothetical protein [Rhodanobacteraceae bacterium]